MHATLSEGLDIRVRVLANPIHTLGGPPPRSVGVMILVQGPGWERRQDLDIREGDDWVKAVTAGIHSALHARCVQNMPPPPPPPPLGDEEGWTLPLGAA
jgi:hypothetical protein